MSPKQLLKLFCEMYKERVGEQYVPSYGRDYTVFKRLIHLLCSDKHSIEELMKLYFEDEARFYSVPFFASSINILIQKKVRSSNEPKARMMVNGDAERFK